MTQWISAAPTLLVALALATIPGLPAAWVLRFRGLTLIAASIVASFALVALASVLAPLLGVPWSVLPVLALGILLAAALLPIRRFARVDVETMTQSRASILLTGGAVFVAFALIGFEIARAIEAPERISQTFDAVFHLNAVAEILSTGDASPLHMNLSSPGRPTGFYPTVWHSFVALVVQLSGASVPVATNVVTIVVAAWVWPIAILFFSRPFFVRRPAHLVLGAVLAASFSAFPYLLLTWGVLYPNLLSTALIPYALGFLYLALRASTVGVGVPAVSLWIGAIGAIGAAALAHPNAVFGIATFSLPIFAVVTNDIRQNPHYSVPSKIARWSLLLLTVVAYVVFWSIFTTHDSRRYDDVSPLGALVDALTNAPLLDVRAWFMSVLVVGGIIVLLIGKRHRWLIGSYLLAIMLYTVAVGFDGPLRDSITGPWYSDAARIAALLPIAAIPLAGAAVALLLDLVTDGLRNFEPRRVPDRVRPLLPSIGAVIVFALVLTGGRGSTVPAQSGWTADLYSFDERPLLLDEDEIALLERLDDKVPDGATIAGDPWSGTALAYAYSGRPTLFPHLQGNWPDAALQLAERFNSMTSAEACALLDRLDVQYMLEFGGPRYDIDDPERAKPFAGLRHISQSPILELIDKEGRAALYRVTCG